MRWVKRDSILVADWPLLDAHNVVPILVSASFLQVSPARTRNDVTGHFLRPGSMSK